LAEAGEEVALVAILDGHAFMIDDQSNYQAGEWRYFFHFLRNIPQSVQSYLQLDPAQKKARRLRWRGALGKRLQRLSGKKVEIEYQDLDENLKSRPVIYQKIFENNWAAITHYSPPRSHNRLVVFCTPQSREKYHDPYLGWKEYTTVPIESQAIAGAHTLILNDQYAPILADKLKPYLPFDEQKIE
jgi:hypothetical protein